MAITNSKSKWIITTYSTIVVFFCCMTNIFGQTSVSGIISKDTTWTKAKSPYLVTGNIMVMENATLTVEAGVVVKFNSDVQLSLRGKLICRGTASDSIKFIDNNVTSWGGIQVNNSSYNPKVELKYLKAKKVGVLLNVASTNNGTDTLLKLTHCTFDSIGSVIGQYDGVKTHIVYIDSCSFSRMLNYVNVGASNNIIKNSKFYGGTSRAFYNSTSQSTIIDNCEFSGYTDAALLVNGIITNSNFHNNKIAIITMDLNSTTIKYNYIHDNVTGIEVWNGSESTYPSRINFNKICNNTNAIKQSYNSKDVYVPYNCWCLTDSTQIQTVMYDFFDAGSRGFIFYMPFDTNCTYSGIGLGLKENQSKLASNADVYPNPFKDEFSVSVNFEIPTVVEITLTDILGHKLSDIYKGIVSKHQNINHNIKELDTGIYFIVIKSERGIITKKVIRL
ncbi:MAG: T9SS type A sorting domain-containing protein [Bacteroidetes bacterium]|nr:T9SS type A sorting domain-containing protein [Bacteroidota bacterium]